MTFETILKCDICKSIIKNSWFNGYYYTISMKKVEIEIFPKCIHNLKIMSKQNKSKIRK